MNMLLNILTVLLAVFLFATLSAGEQVSFDHTPRAQWPSRFSVEFTEKTPFNLMKGKYVYDYEKKATFIARDNARGDRYCASLFRGKTQCNHLVVDGARWLIFPKQDYCCKCCTDKGGCGVIKPDWLNDAEYLGEEPCDEDGDDTVCTKWNQPGLQPNYFWQEKESGTPRRLFQMPNDDMRFDDRTFTKTRVDESLFEPPSYCFGADKSPVQCPRLSVCGVLA